MVKLINQLETVLTLLAQADIEMTEEAGDEYNEAASTFLLSSELKATLARAEQLEAELEQVREHCRQLSGDKFSDRNHAALKSRAETAEARCREMERNDARYRWLRDVHNQGARSVDGSGLIVCTDRPNAQFARYIGPVFGPNLDQAIDAAMSAAGLK